MSSTPDRSLGKALTLVAIGIIGFVIAALMGGCKHAPIKPPAAFAQCDAICYTPCVDDKGDTGVRWVGDPNQAGTIDALGEAVVPSLTDKLRTCDTRRVACVQCLNRLETEGVIVQ